MARLARAHRLGFAVSIPSELTPGLPVQTCCAFFPSHPRLGCDELQGTGRAGTPCYRSLSAFIRDARHNSLLAVPAGLYAVNNYLKFAMQLYFR